MRTVLYGIRLLIDNLKMEGFYINNQKRGRKQDSRETERERVCVRDRAWLKTKDSVSNKIDH